MKAYPNKHIQKTMMRRFIDLLPLHDLVLSGVYMPTDDTDGGVEVNSRYLLQIADYAEIPYFVDSIDGVELGEFSSLDDVIKFIGDKDDLAET